MRPDDLSSKPRGAVLDAPEEMYAPAPVAARRHFGEDFASGLAEPRDDGFDSRRQPGGYKLRLDGRLLQVPKSLWGKIATGIGLLVVAGCGVAGAMAVRSFFLRDARFVIASSSSIQTVGNTHLTRAQLLSVFGEDVDRNIFRVPLAERRAELESLPWVQHATVMRLLPNHLRIAIAERTPVAFVRQGSQIGMVDASGVLLDMPPDAPGNPHYSFPVVTGINGTDPLSTRAARMKIYGEFTGELDGAGEHISEKLSEVDLANPEDIKALIPDGTADILVHFGESDFLERYRKYQQHLQEWRTQYPKLASVDMRYERQVVLEMQPGAAAVAPASSTIPHPVANAMAKPVFGAKLAAKPVAQKVVAKAVPPMRPTTATAHAPAPSGEWHMVVVKPHTKPAAALKAAAPTPSQAAPQ